MEIFEGWQTQHFLVEEPGAIGKTAKYVMSGKIVLLPTDTVYGIGCSAFSEAAIQKLFDIKQRPLQKAIPILIADFSDLSQITSGLPEIARPYVYQYWPGSLTIILPKHPDLPDLLSTDGTIAVRVPDHVAARTLIRMSGGAMAVTSANISDQPPATTAEEALTYFDGIVTAVLDAGSSPMGQPSTIIDCTGTKPKLIREGPIKIL